MSDSSGFLSSVIETAKDRLTNRLYMYMFSSVLVANWQHILIILKSKNDIELTLGLMTFDAYFSFFYFYFPLLIGAALAILMPYCTRFISELTASQYYLIKNSEQFGLSTLKLKTAKRNEKISEIELRRANNEAKADNLKQTRDLLESQSTSYFHWLQGILKAYNETGGKIDTADDLKNILYKLKEHNAIYDLELLPDFIKLMGDIQQMDESNKKDD